MSEKVSKKAAEQDSQKIKCDICEKMLVKGSLKRHRETQHKVMTSVRKSQATTNKKKETLKNEEVSDKNEEEVNQEPWSKVWFSNEDAAPSLSTRDMDQYFEDTDVLHPTFSTGELVSLMDEKEDSILAEVEKLEANMDLSEEWFQESSQNPFGSQFGQEMRRLSLQPLRSCNECKETKSESSKIRKQYDKLLISTNNKLKGAEVQKTFLRKQLKLAESEVQQNRDSWSNDVERLSEEIGILKSNASEKTSNVDFKQVRNPCVYSRPGDRVWP